MEEDKLQQALDRVFAIAEDNGVILHWQIPECDDEGNSLLIQGQESLGMLYYNFNLKDQTVHFYLLEVELYNWAIIEGFTDEDIFKDFNVVQSVTEKEFCDVVCDNKKLNKSK